MSNSIRSVELAAVDKTDSSVEAAMSDVVERLKEFAQDYQSEECRLMREAIAEITRLRERTEWRPIGEHKGERIKALVFGFWEGEINGRDKEPDVFLAEWCSNEWCIEGTDTYAAWVRDVTRYLPITSPSGEKP